ncbi:MAG: carboxynorspermidine decarboxylase [Leptospiraceae bacterium]|nr:carboxynorspermidine decarboxylase [Leptospiraceae bacterium]
MDARPFLKLDLDSIRTPVHIIDEVALTRNLRVLRSVQDRTGAKIILALKAFAQFSVFPLIRDYLPGSTASSLNEARLAAEEFKGEVHLCAPAFPPEEVPKLVELADHIVFNSFYQRDLFWPAVQKANAHRSADPIQCGLRLNPEHRETEVALYDPCAPGSRMGIRHADFIKGDLSGITGLHFHTLCEVGCPPLARTLEAVERKFGRYIHQMQWINWGGGHHISHPDYDVDGLCRLIDDFRNRYHHIQVYLEPGEAIAIRTGVLVSTVLDIINQTPPVVILDTSATAHMPDVLEMPYRPEIYGAGEPGQFAHTYRLGGLTCLAGDVIGDYSFAEPLRRGDRLMFLDMSHYTMVKSSNFNGVRTPSIAIANSDTGSLRVVREFGYEDFRNRLS